MEAEIAANLFEFKKGGHTFSVYYDTAKNLVTYLAMLKFNDIFVFSHEELIKLTNYIGKGGI